MEPAGLFADVGQQTHEASAFDGDAEGSLVSRAGAGPLAAIQLALVRAHFLQAADVLVINEGGPRAAFLGAKAAAVLLVSAQFLPDHAMPSSRFQSYV